jgi:DNA-binding beta-propeller fold protein YncE
VMSPGADTVVVEMPDAAEPAPDSRPLVSTPDGPDAAPRADPPGPVGPSQPAGPTTAPATRPAPNRRPLVLGIAAALVAVVAVAAAFVLWPRAETAAPAPAAAAAGTLISRLIPVGGAPAELAVAEGSVWVRNFPDAITRVDIATGRVDAPIPVRRRIDGITAGGGSLWLSHSDSGTVSRIDMQSHAV